LVAFGKGNRAVYSNLFIFGVISTEGRNLLGSRIAGTDISIIPYFGMTAITKQKGFSLPSRLFNFGK
jgi:hypothetical protein